MKVFLRPDLCMTREHQAAIVDSWAALILLTIRCLDADAAYRITRASLARFREIGAWPLSDGDGREWLIRQGMTAAVQVNGQ